MNDEIVKVKVLEHVNTSLYELFIFAGKDDAYESRGEGERYVGNTRQT